MTIYYGTRPGRTIGYMLNKDGKLETEKGTIREAELIPNEISLETLSRRVELELVVDFESAGTAHIKYASRNDTKSLMKDLGVEEIEDLAGKKVMTHSVKAGHFYKGLVGLSAID